MTNGFCQAGSDNSKGMNLFWRNGCTDPTWKDPACPQYCMGLDKPDTQAVYYCLEGTSWCCMPREHVTDLGTITNTTCCSISDLTFAAPSPIIFTVAMDEAKTTAVQIVSSLGVATVSTQSAATTNTAGMSGATTGTSGNGGAVSATGGSSASSATAAPSSSGSHSMIGVYVGVPLGVVLFIALGVIGWLVLRKRKSQGSDAVQPGYASQDVPIYEAAEPKYSQYGQQYVAPPPSELPHQGVPYSYSELGDNRMR